MGKKLDLTGQKFGKLSVVEFYGKDKHNKTLWKCKCECGNEIVTNTGSLTTGNTKSCGCSRKQNNGKRTHGMSRTRIYEIYNSMKRRCLNPNNQAYKYYGGRGITVSDEWANENGAANFIKWAYKNGYSDNLTLDRIDVNGNYEPSNCRWVDMRTQALNRRNYDSLLGIRGVYKSTSGKKYIAIVKVNRKNKHLGTYETINEAIAARKAAELKYYGQVLQD